jgi:hypothetical protein
MRDGTKGRTREELKAQSKTVLVGQLIGLFVLTENEIGQGTQFTKLCDVTNRMDFIVL